MQIAHIIASNIVATDADALVTLDYEARFIRRKVLKTDAGETFLVELLETRSLAATDGFVLDDGRIIFCQSLNR